jgi:hypothetical protein
LSSSRAFVTNVVNRFGCIFGLSHSFIDKGHA